MTDVIGPGGTGPGTPGPPDHLGGDDSTCAGCGAPLAPDQRYCLACGRPCSPVRLAFLDVLQAEHQPTAAYVVGGEGGPSNYYPAPQEPDGMLGSLRRYSGLLALLGVLVGCLLVGLLVGHWVSQSDAPAGPQVVRIEGLSGPLASAATPTTTTTPSTTSTGRAGTGSTSSSTKTGTAKTATTPASSPAEEAEEAKEEEKEPKPLPPAHKASSTLKKLSETTGKKHAQEVNALGTAPIETGH
jgi:hypothetical protein